MQYFVKLIAMIISYKLKYMSFKKTKQSMNKSWIDVTIFLYFLLQQEIIKWYKDRIKNKIEPQLPKFFKDLPNLPVE